MDRMLELSDTLPLSIIKDVVMEVCKQTKQYSNAQKTYNSKIKNYAKNLNLINHDSKGGDNRLKYKDLNGNNTRVAGYSKFDSSVFDVNVFYEKIGFNDHRIKQELIVQITDSI